MKQLFVSFFVQKFLKYSVVLMLLFGVTLSTTLQGQTVYDFHFEGLKFGDSTLKKQADLKSSEVVNLFINTVSDYAPLSINEQKNLDAYVQNKENIIEAASSKLIKASEIKGDSSQFAKDLNQFYLYITSIDKKGISEKDIRAKISYFEGREISQAYLFILSSYDFWGDDTQAIVLDAAGYIIGWVDAYIDDNNNGEDVSGAWDSPRTWHRIRKGATFGLGCSIGKWL